MNKSTTYSMPESGSSYADVTRQMDELFSGMTPEESGKLASTAFWGVEDSYQIVKETYLKFFSWNALFTFQEAPAAKMENDVLDMCVGLLNGNEETRANLTSGGTESNFCALHAMRNWARDRFPDIKTPEIVAPYSIHSTVHKTARILDIKVVTVAQNKDLTADVSAMIDAIGPNTIGIAASAPNWPYALVDPIEKLSDIALERDLWLHVDACVGAYILPFFRELGEEMPVYDLRVPGVRSITGDLHKYGFAPKPCSTVLWRSQEEQSYHYLPVTEWPCGLYLSQGFVGSRPLAPVAATWALMHYLGHEGYVENARRIRNVRNAIIDRVAVIPGLRTWKTHGPLLQIAADDYDIQKVVGGMTARGWRLLGVQDPPAIHLTVDVLQPKFLEKFLDDLDEVSAAVRSGQLDEEGLLSYGGVGAEETAPKWLLSAIEIMEKKTGQQHSRGK